MNESDNKISLKALELLANIDDIEKDLKSYYLTHQKPTTPKIAKRFAIRYLQANYNFYGYLIYEYRKGNNFLGYPQQAMETEYQVFNTINLALRQIKYEQQWTIAKEYLGNVGQSFIEKAARINETDIDQEMRQLGQAIYDVTYEL